MRHIAGADRIGWYEMAGRRCPASTTSVDSEMTPMSTRPGMTRPAAAAGSVSTTPASGRPDVRRLLRRLGRHADLLNTVAAAPRPATPSRMVAV